MSHDGPMRAGAEPGGVFTSAADDQGLTRHPGTADHWVLTNQGRASDTSDQWGEGTGLTPVVTPDRLATLVSLGHPVADNYQITPKCQLRGAFEIQEHYEAFKINHL